MTNKVKGPSEVDAEKLFKWLCQNPKEVIIDVDDGARLWKLFTGSPIKRTDMAPLSRRALMQALMMRAIDGSYVMGVVEAAFKAAFMKPIIDAKSFGKALARMAKGAAKNYMRNAKNKDLMKAEVYNNILTTLTYKMKPYLDMISQGGDPFTLETE